MPFLKLRLAPSSRNKITAIEVDKDLGSQWVTYTLASGEEESVPLDAFLEYNRDPEYFKKLILHQEHDTSPELQSAVKRLPSDPQIQRGTRYILRELVPPSL